MLKIGDKVLIRNRSLSGRVIVEGEAFLIQPVINSDIRWIVRFTEDEPGEMFSRCVNEQDKLQP